MNREQETQAALQGKLAELVSAPIKEDIADFCAWVAADAKEYFGLPKDDERIGEFIYALPIEHTDCIQFAHDAAVLAALEIPNVEGYEAKTLHGLDAGKRRADCLFEWSDSTKLGKITFLFVQLYQIRPSHYPEHTPERIEELRGIILFRHWLFCAQILTAFAFAKAAAIEAQDSMGHSENRALRLLSKGNQWLRKARVLWSDEFHVREAISHGFIAAVGIWDDKLSKKNSDSALSDKTAKQLETRKTIVLTEVEKWEAKHGSLTRGWMSHINRQLQSVGLGYSRPAEVRNLYCRISSDLG